MLKRSSYNEDVLSAFIAGGDESTFTRLFNSHRDRVYSIAFKITHSASLAEEVAQDVFLIIWLRRDRLAEIQNFSAYLNVIIRNQIYKVLKQIAKRSDMISVTDNDLITECRDESPDQIVVKEYNAVLQKAINRLPSRQKQVYKYIKEEGFKREEVAALLNLSPETIKYHLAEAMRNIRNFCRLYLHVFILFIFIFRY